jgi:hypothetical protein
LTADVQCRQIRERELGGTSRGLGTKVESVSILYSYSCSQTRLPMCENEETVL